MDPLPIMSRPAASFKMHTRQPSFSRQWSVNSSTIEAAMGWKAGVSWTDTDMIEASPFKSTMSMSPPIATSLARSPDSRMEIEEHFCKNYRCCGQDLQDLHELVAHYDSNHSGGSDESTSSMSSSPRSSFSAPGTPGPETAPTPVFADPSQFESKLNAYTSQFVSVNPGPVASPQRVGAFTQPLSTVARTSTWQSYFPAPQDDDEDIFMSDESVMSMRDRSRAKSLPDTTKCLSPSVLTTASLLPSLSARHSVPSLSSNYTMRTQQPILSIPVPPNIPSTPFSARASVVSLPSSSDEDEDDSESSSRWTHRSIKAKPSAKPLKEKAYKCPNPDCQKSYKNPNGLKYHVTKGTCLVA